MLFFGVPGAVTILLGVAVGIYALIERFVFLRGNRAFLYLVILLVIAGLALFMLGFLGELVAGMREEGRGLPREVEQRKTPQGRRPATAQGVRGCRRP